MLSCLVDFFVKDVLIVNKVFGVVVEFSKFKNVFVIFGIGYFMVDQLRFSIIEIIIGLCSRFSLIVCKILKFICLLCVLVIRIMISEEKMIRLIISISIFGLIEVFLNKSSSMGMFRKLMLLMMVYWFLIVVVGMFLLCKRQMIVVMIYMVIVLVRQVQIIC